jgi:hypothetical protein
VLPSIGRFGKLLLFCFKNCFTVVNVKFVHIHFLFANQEYKVFLETARKLSFAGFSYYFHSAFHVTTCMSCI